MYFGQTNMILKIFLIITVILLNNNFLFPQESDKVYLDSLFEHFVSLKNRDQLPEVILNPTPADVKCGFGLISEIVNNIGQFSSAQQNILKKLLQRPTKQKSVISPSGFFRIHFDTTGSQVPNYDPSLTIDQNVTEVAKALDSAYNFEVNFLGYPVPPPDNSEGGDNRYDIYITSADGYYGFTQPDSSLGSQKYTSYIEIHYDYRNYYTKGFNAMRVTVAHEFHHGIQLGNYILRSEDTFFYEITSTSMEEFVYDDVNDYYDYINSYFNTPENAFSNHTGYDLAIWNLYLKENFGFNIIKRQWELMPIQRALNAINMSIAEMGSNFKHELNNFGVWTFHTKHRAITGKYFEEAAQYPLIRLLSTIIFTSPEETVTIQSKPTANNFIRFTNPDNSIDTLYTIISNGDVQAGINNPAQTDAFSYFLYDYAANGTTQIDSNYFSKFSTGNSALWSISEIMDTLINVIEPQIKTDYPYPMPFSYNKNSLINIPVSLDNDGKVGLYILSTSMVLVYSNDDMQLNNVNKNIVTWNVKDNSGSELASGVYFYVVRSGNNIEKGKLVVLHD